MLPAIFRAISAAAENQNHRIQRLQLRQLAMFPGLVGKLVIWERAPGIMSARIIKEKRSSPRSQLWLPLRGSSFEFMYSRPSGPIAVTCVMYSPDFAQ
jgi:hypothetical protein